MGVDENKHYDESRLISTKVGRPAKYGEQEKNKFLETFETGGTEKAAAHSAGVTVSTLENWKARDKEFHKKFIAAMKVNLLITHNQLEEIVTIGDIKEFGRAGYFTSIIKRRENYLARCSISKEKMTPVQRLHNIRCRLADNNLEHRLVKDEVALAESEHKMNMEDLAQRLEVVEKSLRNEQSAYIVPCAKNEQ